MSNITSNNRKKIAPRLHDGYCRVKLYGRLPEDVKEGLRTIAKDEGKSMSWVVEEVVIDYFSLRRPKYVGEKARVLPMRKRA